MAASILASPSDLVVASRRRDGTILANTLHTADHQALLRDLTASWHPESTVVDRRHNHRIPCEIAANLVPLDDQDQTVRPDPLAVLIANLSKCGVGIVHRHPLPHRLALIEYELPSGNLVQLTVRLKWCRFKGADLYESGGQIVRVLQNSIQSPGQCPGQSPERPPEIMNEHLTVELTPHQRDLVLEGLRYIRSSRRFEFRDPSQPRDERRETDLRTIAELMGQLDPAGAVHVQAEA